MIDKDILEMFEKASLHMTRMENDLEYRREIEKRLYAGVSREVIEEIRQDRGANGSIKLVSEIRKIDFGSNFLLAKIQEEAINLAHKSTQLLLKKYEDYADTMGGLYICSDTFKELFPSFAKIENRALVNDAIHNASAVLAATQFEEVLKRSEADKNLAIFITGIPGAGKTTLIKNLMMNNKIKIIFEGQLANPKPSIYKIEKCLKLGLKIIIVAVHIEAEKALENTFKRFNAYGRGGSIEIMSSIQANLLFGLKKLRAYFEEKIDIIAIDRSNNNKIFKDAEEIERLLNVGTKEEIFKRLEEKLNRDFSLEIISQDCFNQAGKTNLENIMTNTDFKTYHQK